MAAGTGFTPAPAEIADSDAPLAPVDANIVMAGDAAGLLLFP